MTLIEILKMVFPDDVAKHKIQVGDRGQGQEIVVWEIARPVPTDKELSDWAIKFQDQYELQQIIEKRQQAYPAKEELIVALWERVVEGREEATDELQAAREQVKQEFPKSDD